MASSAQLGNRNPTQTTQRKVNSPETIGQVQQLDGPTIKQAYDLSKNWLDNTVQQGRETAREASSTKGYYDMLSDNRQQSMNQTNTALTQQTNNQQGMQTNFQQMQQSNYGGGTLAFGGQGNGYNPSNGLAARATNQLFDNQQQRVQYRDKAGVDNYYAGQSRGTDMSFQSQMAGNERAFKASQDAEDRAFQSQQSALDRAQQRKLAMLDSSTKLQSSMLQSLNMGNGGGYSFWNN